MALLETPAKSDNFKAPDFTLKNIDNAMMSLDDVRGEKGTALFFICNHCPYVIAIVDRLVPTAKKLQDMGFGVAAIMANDTENYPADSFENMQKFAAHHNFTFPYLIDETQETARAYGAVCTPDIFGFDAGDTLKYRGRLDSAGPQEASADTAPELLEAMRQIEQGQEPTAPQFPSMGCSIKWR